MQYHFHHGLSAASPDHVPRGFHERCPNFSCLTPNFALISFQYFLWQWCSKRLLDLIHRSAAFKEIRRAAWTRLFPDVPPLKTLPSSPLKLYSKISRSKRTQVQLAHLVTSALHRIVLSLFFLMCIFLFSFIVWLGYRPKRSLAHIYS